MSNHINGNLYHYAGNNPVRYVDPDGRDIHTLYFGELGAKLIIGGNISVGIALDDKGNAAIAVTSSAGIGLEADVGISFSLAGNISVGKNLDDLKGIGAFKVDSDASVYGLETNIGIGLGINIDNKTSEVTGWNMGVIGGGVTFASVTLYIMLRPDIGNLAEQYNKLDDADRKEFIYEIRESKQIPEEIKKQIISAMEEDIR